MSVSSFPNRFALTFHPVPGNQSGTNRTTRKQGPIEKGYEGDE